MENLNVQFEDSTREKIIAVFLDPQDPVAVPNQGTIADDDSRYHAFKAVSLAQPSIDPVEKLKNFLAENPDVAAILS